jgi:hypothetical protein
MVARPNRIFKGTIGLLFNSLCLLTAVYAQNSAVENNVKTAFDQYRRGYIQERLYVHTDRNSYLSREILWFRIYYVDIFFNRPASISKIAYIELLDKYNHPILQQKVSLKPGESNGSFTIPVNIPSGMYRLRAYTNWMKNFSPEYYFEKSIHIMNPSNLQPDSVPSKLTQYDIQFFPEGGNLVQNIESKVAFRVTDAFGKGLNFEGFLLNTKSDTILRFHPSHLGMGNFIFTPAASQQYNAVILFSNGEKLSKTLPASFASGYVMNLSKTKEERIAIKITSSADLTSSEFYLFLHGSHSSLPVIFEKLDNHESLVLVDPEKLDDGISRITLFNNEGQPVCERLYFKYPVNNLYISASVHPEYKTRDKINLNLDITNQSGKPVNADMSMAVYRLDSLQNIESPDIRNYFYLTADLGAIECPGFYFNDSVKSRETEMDNLMMTQGWRRFIWKIPKGQNSLPVYFSPEHEGHIISGKLVDNISGNPVQDISIYLSIPSTRTQFRVTTSEAGGVFTFEMPGFYGSQELILQTNPDEDSTCHVDIANPFSEKYSGRKLPEFVVPLQKTAILDQSIAEQVQHTFAGSRLNQFTQQGVDSGSFYSEPDETYLLDNYTRFQTMEEVIREYVMSANVTIKQNKFQLRLVNKPERAFFKYPPLILIDGVPFFDVNELFHQDPSKIKRIELVNKRYALGFQYFEGILNATTFNGDLNGILLNPRVTVLDYPGIPEQREFYSPAYETEEQINSPVPDFRTLLYWTPDVKTDIQHQKTISFYTSDQPGKYVFVIMGLTTNGEPGSRVIPFIVNKRPSD